MEIIEYSIVTFCGFAIGVLSGMFGIGGGGLIVPLLHMAFGLPIIGAASTSLLTIAPTGISGSIKHIRQKTVSLKFGLLVGGFGALASVAGSLIANELPDSFVVLLTVVVILFSVGMMVRTLLKDKEKGTDRDEVLKKRVQKKKISTLLVPIGVGLIAGSIAGIVGVGGGFIIVPFCVAYLGFSMKEAAGTSLVAIAIIAIPGIISHALMGHIWWFYGLAIIIGTIPGAQLGAWLITRLPERPMRFAFAGLLTLIGVMMLAQELFL